MAKKQRPSEGGGNWMDTYGDLVTLLLTFFVMLYSMSTLDAKKWEIFVRSIGPNKSAEVIEDVAINAPLSEEEELLDGSMEIPETETTAEELYLTLMEKLNETGIDVSVSRGENYTFIVFQDNPFFDGDSSVLTSQGKEVLDVFCQVLDGANDLIAQLNIMGHTAQAQPDKPNTIRTDRMLSAMRSAEVCIYIQEKQVLDPEKLVCLSYGQHRPVASFDTAEDRAKNRRVELLLLDQDADVDMMNDFYEDLSGDYTEQSAAPALPVEDDGFGSTPTRPEDVATQISPLQINDTMMSGGSGDIVE